MNLVGLESGKAITKDADRLTDEPPTEVTEVADFEGKMAPRDGFEPPAKRLTVACSTAELPGNNGDTLIDKTTP